MIVNSIAKNENHFWQENAFDNVVNMMTILFTSECVYVMSDLEEISPSLK